MGGRALFPGKRRVVATDGSVVLAASGAKSTWETLLDHSGPQASV